MAENILLTNFRSPGDYVVLSAAVRDLCRAHPGRFNFMVKTPQPMVFNNNPYLTPINISKARVVEATYDKSQYSIHQSNQKQHHFLWGFIGDLNIRLKANAVLTEFKPDLHLTDEEKAIPLVKKPYWVFASGGKMDFTAKWWDFTYWQQTIDQMAKWMPMVQVGGGSHIHPKTKGVLDLVGKTSFRDLMRLIYHSEGVICIVTCLMHIAAAFNKPCVVVAGGREHWWWEAYNDENRLVNLRRGIPDWKPPIDDNFVPHRYIHTIGKLDCCLNKGCWKSHVEGTKSLCSKIVNQHGRPLPKCMEMITPDKVLREVEWYYEKGILSRTTAPAVIPVEVAPPEPIVNKLGYSHPDIKTFIYSMPGSCTAGEFVNRTRCGKLFNNRTEGLRAAFANTESAWTIWIEDPIIIKDENWLHKLEKMADGKQVALGLVHRDVDTKTCYLDERFFMVPTHVLRDINIDSPTRNLDLAARLQSLKIPMIDIGEVVEYL